MRQKEGKLDDKIRVYCKSKGLFYLKTNGGGIPDCIICVNGLFVVFETKVDNNVLSELQKYWLNYIKNCGGKAYEVRSIEQAIEILEELQK